MMSSATLTNLLDYLCGTLTPSNMRWVGEHLIECARREEEASVPKPFTMEEINAMLDEAEQDFEAGKYLTHDEVFHRHKEALAV